MLLMDPKSAAVAVGQSCRKKDGSDNETLLELLRLITPRVEGMLEVRTLSRGTYRDTFESPVPWSFPFRTSVLLSNAFIVPDSIVVSGANYTDGYEFDPLRFDLRLGFGSISPRYFPDHLYSVEYQSGFAIPGDPADPSDPNNTVHVNPDYRVAIDVPEFIRTVVSTLLINHFRTKLSAPIGIPKDGGLGILTRETRMEIQSIIGSSYLRPRSGLRVPISSVKV